MVTSRRQLLAHSSVDLDRVRPICNVSDPLTHPTFRSICQSDFSPVVVVVVVITSVSLVGGNEVMMLWSATHVYRDRKNHQPHHTVVVNECNEQNQQQRPSENELNYDLTRP